MKLLIHLNVMMPEKKLIDTPDVSRLQLRLVDGGLIGILPGHAPLIAQTVTGALSYSNAAGEHEVQLQPGILHIASNEVTILTGGYAPAIPAPLISEKQTDNRLRETFVAQFFTEEGIDAERT